MNHLLKFVPFLLLLTACVNTPDLNNDPYPGSGGLYFGTPNKADINSGRLVYDESKFSNFEIGKTKKQQVVNLLGKPANWTTKADGSSSLGYDFVEKQAFWGMRQVVRVKFEFNSNLVLTEAHYPKKS